MQYFKYTKELVFLLQKMTIKLLCEKERKLEKMQLENVVIHAQNN